MSLQPPPSLIIVDSIELQADISSYLAVLIASAATAVFSKSRICICAIIIESSLDVLKPPCFRQRFAILLAAATMLDSSTQNGIKYAFSSIMKLVAIPTGSDIVPITFSII